MAEMFSILKYRQYANHRNTKLIQKNTIFVLTLLGGLLLMSHALHLFYYIRLFEVRNKANISSPNHTVYI